MPFHYTTKVQLYHTDAAGVLFYSKIFDLAFNAFDALLEKCGVSVAYIIRESDFSMPFVRAEADYLAPLMVDDVVTIRIIVEKIGDTSFVLNYELTKAGVLAARVKTVHVTISKETLEKIPLPLEIRQGLELYAAA